MIKYKWKLGEQTLQCRKIPMIFIAFSPSQRWSIIPDFFKMWASHSNLLSKSAIWKRGLGGQSGGEKVPVERLALHCRNLTTLSAKRPRLTSAVTNYFDSVM